MHCPKLLVDLFSVPEIVEAALAFPTALVADDTVTAGTAVAVVLILVSSLLPAAFPTIAAIVPILGKEAVSVETAEASARKESGIGRGGGPMAAAEVKRSVSFCIIPRKSSCWTQIRRLTVSSRPGHTTECFDFCTCVVE